LTVGQVFVGILSGSQGLIAGGIHSLSDLVADFVVLLANYKSKKEADEDHPYGHHRYENAASLVLGALLLAVAKRVRSSMLVANAWHARSDAALSLVVAIGIIGNLLGYAIFDPLAALIVGVMVAKMGYSFMWDSLHDLMDRAVDAETEEKIKTTLLNTKGISGMHDLKTRKAGDLIVVDVHLEIDGTLSVKEGHDML
jgi:cation diffusion facilitator family transporter